MSMIEKEKFEKMTCLPAAFFAFGVWMRMPWRWAMEVVPGERGGTGFRFDSFGFREVFRER